MKKIFSIISCIALIATVFGTTSCCKSSDSSNDDTGVKVGNYIQCPTKGQEFELNDTGTLETVDNKTKITFTSKEDPNIYISFICNKIDDFKYNIVFTYNNNFDGSPVGTREHQIIIQVPYRTPEYILYDINSLNGEARRPTITSISPENGVPITRPTISQGTYYCKFKDNKFEMDAVYNFASQTYTVKINGTVVSK